MKPMDVSWPGLEVARRTPRPRLDVVWTDWLPPSLDGSTPEGFEDLD